MFPFYSFIRLSFLHARGGTKPGQHTTNTYINHSAVPGVVIGWIPMSPGAVGLLMLGSTYLTGKEVWERCGKELAVAQAT
jgi:hypothetical protein